MQQRQFIGLSRGTSPKKKGVQIGMAIELAAVATALRALKSISDIAKNVNSIELTQKIIELQNSVLEMQQQMTELSDNNRSLKNQLEEQMSLQAIGDDMEFLEDGGFYIRQSERTAGKHIAYCPLCWKADHKDVPLKESGRGYFFCPIHKVGYETEAYRQDSLRQHRQALLHTRAGGPWS